MCIITTSYPCPEGNTGELLHRLNNTRKVVPCDIVSSPDGRSSSCAGDIQVRHHHLGQSDLCSSCSLAAKTAYVEMRDRAERKRKAETAAVDKEGEKDEVEAAAKKVKTVEVTETGEVQIADTGSEVTETENDGLVGTASVVQQAKLVDIAKEVDGLQETDEAPAVEGNSTVDSQLAVSEKPKADHATEAAAEAAADRSKETQEVAEAIQQQTDDDPTPQVSPVNTSEMVVETITGLDVDSTNTAKEEPKHPSPATTSTENAKKAGKLNGEVRVAATGRKIPKTPGAEQLGISEFDQVQLLTMKMNQKRIKAERDRDDALKRNSTLVAQISQHQEEIATLNTRLSQQTAQHQAEMEKKRVDDKDVGAESAAMKLQKQDFEAKIGRLVQKNDELVRAVSAANEETNAVKARIRGQQNRVADLEDQMGIFKQAEDGRKKQLGEARGDNEVMQRQNLGYRTKVAGVEADNAKLKQRTVEMEEENTRLRAAVVQRLLSTPASEGPSPESEGLFEVEE